MVWIAFGSWAMSVGLVRARSAEPADYVISRLLDVMVRPCAVDF